VSTYMRARLASDKVDNHGLHKPLGGFRVALLGLAADVTKPDGTFEFKHYRAGRHRTLELIVQDKVGRVLPFAATTSDRFAVYESYLFSLKLDFVGNLDQRLLLNDLKQEFQNHDQPLNLQEAEVEVKQVHSDWTIINGNIMYAIRRKDQALNVYQVSGRILFEDVDDEQIIGGDFIIREADAQGFLVTLGTGKTPVTLAPGESSTGPTVASGWGLSHGNVVTLLMDQDAFTHAAALIRGAQESVLLSQLYFNPLPVGFNPDATRETTKLVFDFHKPPPDADHPRAAGVGDARPERLLVEAADKGVDIRILLHGYKVPLIIKIIAGALLFPFAGTDGIFAGIGGLLDAVTDADEAKRYFGEAARPNIKVQDFQQPVLSAGVMHAKLVVVDGRHALSIGSPFEQSYVDTHDHLIDAPIRGDRERLPMHDAGFAVTGPAVGDLHQTLKLLWDKDAAPDDRLTTLPRNPPPQTGGGDGVCSMQIVRTLSSKTFDDPRDGEKGILEAYLRAIANADDFIYLENQYFTDDLIGHALVEAMKHNRDLQVIVVLNIQPDVWFYPFKQRRLITRIREGIAKRQPDDPPQLPPQFGVFTRWTHETGQPRPRILPVYVHAKLGIVDKKWATVGSANLDGLSLDSCLVGDKINAFFRFFFGKELIREERAVEVNAIMLNKVDDQPPSDVVDILRRKLWAEHLGSSAQLMNRPQGGWLKLWSDRAKATLQQLKDNPSLPLTGMARVLPWPTDNTTHKTPRDHLEALGVHTYAVVPLKSTRAFDFKTGDWKRGSKAAMDYD
jgi:phosphatidylserine/phosphatidylglycerophosphate/cardiolipin synthase-like enzyme